MVSVAVVASTLLVARVSSFGATAVEASEAAPSPVAFTARTLNW